MGYSMLMYYANMLNIPGDIYEAATIDGASNTQQFSGLPCRFSDRPTLRCLFGCAWFAQVLRPAVCAHQGGPNYATEFFSTYIYKQSFEMFNQGYASAIVMFMFLIAMLITLAQLKLYPETTRIRSWRTYETIQRR